MNVPTKDEFDRLSQRVQNLEDEIEQAHLAVVEFVSKIKTKNNVIRVPTKTLVKVPKDIVVDNFKKRKYNKTPRKQMDGKHWSNTDLAILEVAYGSKRQRPGTRIKHKSMQKLISKLKRSRQAISSKAHDMGFTG